MKILFEKATALGVSKRGAFMPLRQVSSQYFVRKDQYFVRCVINHPDYDDFIIWGPVSEADAKNFVGFLNRIPCNITYNGSGPFGLSTDPISPFAFAVEQSVVIRYGDCSGQAGTIRDRWLSEDGEPAYLLSVDQYFGTQTGVFAESQLSLRELVEGNRF